ncbi:short chain dehydrogenase protein [Rutstroemia sp. NJR-2017a BVV2]|nr:short chain dehydrogenase protein [Rutstroemia sp. NJR-2017a BVV2]
MSDLQPSSPSPYLSTKCPPPKTILLTGANRGLGLAIIHLAATRDPSSHYILAGRKARNTGITAPLDLLKTDVTNDTDIAAVVGSMAGLMSSQHEPHLRRLACMRAAFRPLLYRPPHPKVINITSGLGSISNNLDKPMRRLPVSKTAVGGLTAQLQGLEDELGGEEEEEREEEDQ